MREAKLAASVFGVITACLIGGGAVAYNAAPQVSTRDNFEIVEPAYNGMTLTAETSEENKTAITEPAKEKTETTKKTAHAVKLSYIAATADSATAVASVATTFQSVTETAPQTTTQAATAAVTTVYTTENYDWQWTETTTVLTEPETSVTTTEAISEPSTEPETVTEPETEPATEDFSEPDTEPATEDVIFVPDSPASGLPISESDFILLCNVVAHEAGSYWIGSYEKAYVAEVVMNRVYSPLYPNTVYGVLTQPYQFSGSSAYVNLGTYSGYVTESVKEAVRLYFTEPDSFTQGYMSFYGDGIRNYFR